MKQLVIKQMHLLNFKGARDLTISFNESLTSIYGMNGTGKTTIFDAFTWLLFGKDSKDRKKFDLKTLDDKGMIIPNIPHEVSAILILNGEEITLTRRFTEKWVKPKGKAEKEFQGNEEERLYNDVPCSMSEWNTKIADICSEQTFKFITNPLYFTAQKADVQRSMLFRMAGEISDSEIAGDNEDFKTLLANLTGKTMDEYKKEIGAKKKRIKSEYETIPDRIDERKRDIPQAENWNALETELKTKNEELTEIDALIADKAKAASKANEVRMQKIQDLNDIRIKITTRKAVIRQEAVESIMEGRNKQNELKRKVQDARTSIERHNSTIATEQTRLQELSAKRERLIAEWREINARTLSFDEKEFICPTCGRRYEIDEIEAKQDELTRNFNAKKSEDLRINNEKGQAVKVEREKSEEIIKRHQESIAEAERVIKECEADPVYSQEFKEPDIQPMLDADAEYQQLVKDEAYYQASIEEPLSVAPDEELNAQKKSVTSEIDSLKSRLSKRETIERNEARIKELEQQYRNQTEEYAKLEGIEFTIQAFAKAKVDAVESRINGLFSMVKFKMFDTQINGGEVETCEATVDGIPYSVLNDARRINAGIDIINAICKHEQVTAPIIIDNAESINTIIPSESQIIRLVVTENDSTLRVQ